MEDNATTELLVKYMDGELNAAEQEATKKLLQENTALQERYQYLLAAKRAIRLNGIKQQVQAVHQEYMQDIYGKQNSQAMAAKGANTFKIFMRIAAVFIVMIISYGVYQYASVTSQSVYSDNYISYQLPVNRGDNLADNLDVLYNAGNYGAVINTFNAAPAKNQKNYFLAGQAYLHLNNANAAIAAFQQVEKLNTRSAERYFEQETDYYLMLAYIKANKIEEAEKLLNKITSDKQHLFYNKAKEISRIKLTMLKWK